MYRRAENQCRCCAFIIFKGLIKFVKHQQGTLPVRRRRDFHAQEKNLEVRNVDRLTSGPHRKGHTPKRLALQYVVLGPRLFWTDEIFARWIKHNKNTNVSDYLLISLLLHDEVSAFLLQVKARNSSLLTDRPICLSWSVHFFGSVNYMVMFT